MGLSRSFKTVLLFLFATCFTLGFLTNSNREFTQKVQETSPVRIRKIQLQTKHHQQDDKDETELSKSQLQPEDPDKDIKMANIKEFFNYVENPTRTCNNSKVFGGANAVWKTEKVFDGDKDVCLDKEFNINPQKCLVYSFGINNEWSFDDSMARFGCQIYSFDPTMNKKSHKRSDKISFYNIGISDKDGFVKINGKQREVKHFTSIMSLLGHLQDDVMIDYLKMDVEGAEVPFLEDMLQNSPHILKRIKQIGMEIHVGRYNKSRKHIFQKNYKLFKQLERLGFRLFSSKMNPYQHNKYLLRKVRRKVNGYYELVWGLWPSSH